MNFNKKTVLIITCFVSCITCLAQNKLPDTIASRVISLKYHEDLVSVLIKSKKGEENIKKPLFLYVQGSLDRPLIINYPNNKNFKYSIAFPFNTENLVDKYHVAVISKPFIPVVANIKNVDNNYCYIDSITNKIPINFSKNDNLKYLTNRNLFVIKQLQKEKYINNTALTILGHSEGSRIAVEMATKSKKITQLIYLSGNPFGRFINTIGEDRNSETETDNFTDEDFDYWKKIVANKNVNNYKDCGDTFISTFVYSKSYIKQFLKLKIPVFIGYGTKDNVSIFNDYLRLEAIRLSKSNFVFHAYIGLEHSFYPVLKNGEIDHKNSKIDTVIADCIKWIYEN